MRKLAMILVSLAALGAVVYVVRGHGGAPRPPALPVRPVHVEALMGFIKHSTCQLSSCTGFVCEIFSDGQSKGAPAHLARCLWSDSTTADFRRCAYVHYSVDAQEKVFTDLYLSSVAHSDSCTTDQAFNDLLKKDVGYSGALP